MGAREDPKNKPDSGATRPRCGVNFWAKITRHGTPVAQGVSWGPCALILAMVALEPPILVVAGPLGCWKPGNRGRGHMGVFLKGCRPRESHRGGEETTMVGRAGVAELGQVRLPEMVCS